MAMQREELFILKLERFETEPTWDHQELITLCKTPFTDPKFQATYTCHAEPKPLMLVSTLQDVAFNTHNLHSAAIATVAIHDILRTDDKQQKHWLGNQWDPIRENLSALFLQKAPDAITYFINRHQADHIGEDAQRAKTMARLYHIQAMKIPGYTAPEQHRNQIVVSQYGKDVANEQDRLIISYFTNDSPPRRVFSTKFSSDEEDGKQPSVSIRTALPF